MIDETALEFDTQDWRELRDDRLRSWIQNESAVQFILSFSDACELFDDLIDKDKEIQDSHVIRVLFDLLTEMPLNAFWNDNKLLLIPVIVTGINAWLDANELEKGDRNDKVFSFVLRDWYMELIAFVIYLTRGKQAMRESSMEIRRFFTHHETLEEYRRKLS